MKLLTKLHQEKFTKSAIVTLINRIMRFSGIMVSLALCSYVYAQPLAEFSKIPFHQVKSGSLYFKGMQGYYTALKQNSDYQVQVDGLLARVEFSQVFVNDSDAYVEATYVFPLIDDAAVDAMVMEIGERRIVGQIKERKQAKKLYQQAKKQGKKASLVSQQRPNMFTTKISNIAPGETIKITISYLQSVNYTDEEFSIRIPLTITPRYLPSHNTSSPLVSDENEIENRTHINESGWAEISPPQTRVSAGQKVNIDVNLSTGIEIINITSQYHKISKRTHTNSTAISLANKSVLLDRDFVLRWQVSQGNAPKGAFFQTTDNDYHYGLLMVMPPNTLQTTSITKQVTYIIDTSGSMGGVAIRQAKEALTTALDLLNNDDTFNIIAFNNDKDTLFSHSLEANSVNITLAKHWLSKLRAGGGTNMYPALKQALQYSQHEDYGVNQYQQVIFITDGSVANEQQLFNLIEKDLANTRLHTVGIGSAPNSYFMSRAAEYGRGTYRYIGSVNEVTEQMHQLFSDISKPQMKDIKVNWPVDDVEYFPALIPDLYQNQPLIISARWPRAASNDVSKIEITGQLAHSSWHDDISITGSGSNLAPGVDQWWARKKIKYLRQLQQRSNEEESKQLKGQMTQLALKHHLVSPYTSFVAIEEKITRPKNEKISTKKIANLMPKGSMQAVPFSNTALGIKGYLYCGLLLLIISVLINRRSNKITAK